MLLHKGTSKSSQKFYYYTFMKLQDFRALKYQISRKYTFELHQNESFTLYIICYCIILFIIYLFFIFNISSKLVVGLNSRSKSIVQQDFL